MNIEIYKYEAMAFNLVFLLRRLAFAFIISHVDTNVVYQVFIIDAMSTAILAYYITVMPMNNRVNNMI